MDMIKEKLDIIFSNKYTSTILSLFLVLYGGLAAPKLPKQIVELLTKDIVRVIVLSLIIYSSRKDTRLSIMIGVVFLLTMNSLSDKESFEELKKIKSQENFTDSESESESDNCASKRCEHLLNTGLFIKHNLLTLTDLIKGTNPTIDLKKLFNKNNNPKSDDQINRYVQILEAIRKSSEDFHKPGPFIALRNTLIDISRVLDPKNEIQKIQKESIEKTLLHMSCHIENLTNEDLDDFNTPDNIVATCGETLRALT